MSDQINSTEEDNTPIEKSVTNTKATQNQYDYVSLVGLTADGWLIDDIRGTWVDQG